MYVYVCVYIFCADIPVFIMNTAFKSSEESLRVTGVMSYDLWSQEESWGRFHGFDIFSPQIIFRFALALFKYKEEEFLKLQDSTAIFKYLRCFTRTILDSR